MVLFFREEFEGKLKGISRYLEDVLTEDALTEHLILDSRYELYNT